MRAAAELVISGRRSMASPATRRFTSISRIRLPSGAMVAPGNIFTLRRYSPMFLMTISSLRITSSTMMPTWRPPTLTITMPHESVDRFDAWQAELLCRGARLR